MPDKRFASRFALAGLCLLGWAFAAVGAAAGEGVFDWGGGGAFDTFETPVGGAASAEVDPLRIVLAAVDDGPRPDGAPTLLALRLEHARGHYGYWINPGETGAPPRLEWTLPEGFSVSDARWPAPARKVTAGYVSYAMEGSVTSFHTLRAPAGLRPGERISVAVRLDALVCSDQSCFPVEREARIELTVPDPARPAARHPAGPAAADWSADWSRLPVEATGWTFSLSPRASADASAGAGVNADAGPPSQAGAWTLVARPGKGASADPGSVYFFESTYPGGLLNPKAPQTWTRGDDGLWRLTLTPATPPVPTPSADRGDGFAGDDNDNDNEDAEGGDVPVDNKRRAAPSALRGVLVASKGWLDGDVRTKAFLIDIIDIPMASALPSPASGAPSASTTAKASGGSGADESVDASVTDLGSAPLWWLFAFLGGLILNVMPCVFPVLGLKVMSMVRHAHQENRAVAAHGLAYSGGVLLCFWAVAAVAIALGRAWGAQLQSPVFVFVLCYVFLALALNMAGVFEVGMLNFGGGCGPRSRDGLRHSFFTGVLATLTSTPCSAPFLGSALAYALSLPVLSALAVFTVMAAGFALPYLLLTLFPGALRRLPRPGPWMENFRRGMSFPLFGTALYMAWIYDGLDRDGLLPLLLGMVATAFGCWLYGRHQERSATRRVVTPTLVAAAVFVSLGLWWGWPRGLAVADAVGADGSGMAGGSGEARTGALVWEPWSPERVAALRAAGRTVYVDFTARWCVTCQVNKRVFGDESLREALRREGVALLRADWTRRDPTITRVLRSEFNKAAVPVNVIYHPGAERAVVLPDLLTVGQVLEALEPPD